MTRDMNIQTSTSFRVSILMLLSCMLLPFSSLWAQDGDSSPLSVKVTKKKMAVNENIVLEISVTDDIDNFTAPVMEDFNILSGPSQFTSTSYSNINGRSRTERKTTISYIIQPRKEGSLIIGPATVIIDGKTHRSEGITIEVGPAIAGQNSAASHSSTGANMVNIPDSAKDNIHLVASVSDASPYIGEPITVTYKLYFRVNIGKIYVNSLPKFDSFWTQTYQESDIDRREGEQDYYKDELYHVATFHKVMLIPQKAGRYTIDPLSANMMAEVSTGQFDWWGEEITRVSQISVNSNSLSINVRELPAAGRPADFSGAVGQYSMEVKLSPEQVQTGASSTLSVNIKGSGNIPLLHAPDVSFPQEIESYDPQTSSESRLGNTSMTGSIKEQYILIPRIKGTYTIPDVRFSYFNPKTGKYATLSSGEKQLTATGDAPATTAAATTAPNAPAAAEKTNVDYLNNDIRYISHDNQLVEKNRPEWYNTGLFALLALLPLCVIPLLLGKKLYDSTVDRNSPEARAKRAASLAKRKLSRAKRALDSGDYQTFYCELENAIYSFIQDKLKIRRSDASIENIGGRLISRGADPQIASHLTSVLESCNMARYAGFSSGTANEDYESARRAIEEVNKSVKN